MTIQITKSEIEALINQRLQTGGFTDAEDVVFQALLSSPTKPATTSPTDLAAAKDMVELFAPLRGLNLDFEADWGAAGHEPGYPVKGYLVDTNVPSELTREKLDPPVAAFLGNARTNSPYLSVMMMREISNGITVLPPSEKRAGLQGWLDIIAGAWFPGRILSVTKVIAERWVYLSASAKRQGMTTGRRGRYHRGTKNRNL